MLSSFFFNAQLQPTVSGILSITKSDSVVASIMEAARRDIDYLLMTENDTYTGIIPIKSLLAHADCLATLSWDSFWKRISGPSTSRSFNPSASRS